MKDNILVLYSGGMGSFLTANLIRERFPHKKIKLYFNDTDRDRFNEIFNPFLDRLSALPDTFVSEAYESLPESWKFDKMKAEIDSHVRLVKNNIVKYRTGLLEVFV